MVLNAIMLWFRPSRVLGLLLLGVVLAFTLFAIWVVKVPHIELFGRRAPTLDKANWLFLTGVCGAVCGWIISSLVTIRNSIKQHTINTLLQTRLSATYMEEARHVNDKFFSKGKPIAQVVEHLQGSSDDSKRDYRAVTYFLNYFEFVAVGIRHGDLDEKVLRGTLRGIVLNMREICGPYIRYARGCASFNAIDDRRCASPHLLEHFLWLTKRWKR